MTSVRAFVFALCVALVAGCVPSLPARSTPREPRTRVPESYGSDTGGQNSGRTDWRAFFGDPQLASLIDTALENNQELNILIQETLIANNEVMALRGEYLPSLGFGAGAGIEHVGLHTSQGQNDEQADVPAHLQDYRFGLYASWEIDIWGRLHDQADAGVYRYLASLEGQRFMVTRIVAEIAEAYYELVSLDSQLAFIRNNIQLQEDSLAAVRLQQQAARVTLLAVRRFEAQLSGFQSRQFEVAQRIVETENRINFLVGRFPQHVDRTSTSVLDLQPPAVSLGLPAQLLENRPDVRRAELELRAARLDVSAARARFYPALSLEANLGYQSFNITQLVNTPDSILYNLFANVMAPLLNRNAITADYYSASSRQQRAVVEYERAILTAYIDVNNGLNMIRNLSQSYELKTQQVARLNESIEISNLLFNSARADYLEVLTTRRDALEAQMELIETKQRQLAASVAVYQALGGGWRRRGEGDVGSVGAPVAPRDASVPAVESMDGGVDAAPEATGDAGDASPDAAVASPDAGVDGTDGGAVQ